MFGQEFWDERYSSRPALWSGAPNPRLVEHAADLRPGSALDIGSGEGADAIWLAERGWQVTAVDISEVALRRGAARAAEVGTDVAHRIEWRREDVRTWQPDVASHELVSAQYMQLPKDSRALLIRRLAASVKPGGTLLVVGHHPSDLETIIGRRRMPELLFTPSEVAAQLDTQAWDILVAAAPERTAVDPDRVQVTIHDSVLRARRRE